jgi:response regulator RpfG family c-di-GMP phosphodiesterase
VSEKILCVDDDQNVLMAFRRYLRKLFQIDTASDGAGALRAIAEKGPYAVVVSDLRMPGMDGIEFLSRVREVSPLTVRIMLTGNADITAAIGAVNEGNIFRFLTKPAQPSVLVQALSDALTQYGLVTAEKDLLEKTLSGCTRMLTEILSIADPPTFGRACSVRDHVRSLHAFAPIPDRWSVELSAMLAQIASVTIPPDIVRKGRNGESLSPVEGEIFERMPETGYKLLVQIPRLEPVARAVLYQNKHFDGSGFPPDSASGEEIPLGGRILKLLLDLTDLESRDVLRRDALEMMEQRSGWYDPRLLKALRSALTSPAGSANGSRSVRLVCLKDLRVGHFLLSDVETRQGVLLIPSGHRISETLLERLGNFARVNGIKEPIRIEEAEAGP